jgi:hypothetical protein
MLNNDYFTHNSQNETTPAQRDLNAGYQGTGGTENIAWQGTTGSLDQTQAVSDAEQGLFVDSREQGRGHRLNLLNPNLSEVGPGIEFGVAGPGISQDGNSYNAIMVTQDFGTPANGQPFLTGVMYHDLNQTHFYAPGEGIQGGTVTATNQATGQVFATTTGTSGGYAMPLPAGTYTVSLGFSTNNGPEAGGGEILPFVTIGNSNVKEDLDFTI